MKVNIAGADEVKENVRMLIVGQSSLDRMHFARTAPSPLWVSVNANKTFLARYNLPYVEIDSIDTLFDLKVSLEKRESVLGFPVESVVFDSVEELQRILLAEHLEKQGRTETKIDDWSWISTKLHSIFAAFCALDIDLIFLSGIKDIPMSENETWIKPAIQGSFADQIHRYMDYSLLLRSGSIERPVEGYVGALQKEDGEVTLIGSSTSTEQSTWFTTKPLIYAEWIFDSSETLPARLELNDGESYVSIVERRNKVDLRESASLEVDPYEADPDEVSEDASEDPSPTETQTDKPVCDECGGEIESGNWLVLAEMKGFPPLCKKHFTARNK